jgi:hypothetical protein
VYHCHCLRYLRQRHNELSIFVVVNRINFFTLIFSLVGHFLCYISMVLYKLILQRTPNGWVKVMKSW